MFITHDWEWFIYTTYKNCDDWGMVYGIVLHALTMKKIERVIPP